MEIEKSATYVKIPNFQRVDRALRATTIEKTFYPKKSDHV